MRGVADEHHAAMHETVDAPAIEACRSRPIRARTRAWPSMPWRAAGADAFRLLLALGSASGQAADRCARHCRAGGACSADWPVVKGRSEPEAALGRKIRGHAHVGDQELVLEGDAGEVEAEQARARSSARHRRRSANRRRAGKRPSGVSIVSRDSDRCARSSADHAVSPAQIDARRSRQHGRPAPSRDKTAAD